MHKKKNFRLLTTGLFLIFSVSIRSIEKVCLTCIPKAGTHVVMKLLEQVIPGNHFFEHDLLKVDKARQGILLSSHKLILHTTYSHEALQLLTKNHFKIITIIRDPRDQIVSHAYWIKKYPEYYKQLTELNFDRLITALIIHAREVHAPYLLWKKCKLCYATTFEKLIGAQGGGSANWQRHEIKNIAKFLGIDMSESQVLALAKSIFSKTATFREGKIGAWKSHFTVEHKRLFKRVMGDLLIQLGYEYDYSW